jgi:hypothetical protein
LTSIEAHAILNTQYQEKNMNLQTMESRPYFGDKHATVDIMQDGFIRTVWVSESGWALIAHVDYIELDSNGELTQEFRNTYDAPVRREMVALVLRSFREAGSLVLA